MVDNKLLEKLGVNSQNDMICIAHLTLVVAMSEKEADGLLDSELEEIKESISSELNKLAKMHGYGSSLKFISMRIELSCLIVTLSVCAAILAGAYKLVKEYPDLKKGALEIAKDLDKVRVHIKNKEHFRSICVRNLEYAQDELVEKALVKLRNINSETESGQSE